MKYCFMFEAVLFRLIHWHNTHLNLSSCTLKYQAHTNIQTHLSTKIINMYMAKIKIHRHIFIQSLVVKTVTVRLLTFISMQWQLYVYACTHCCVYSTKYTHMLVHAYVHEMCTTIQILLLLLREQSAVNRTASTQCIYSGATRGAHLRIFTYFS